MVIQLMKIRVSWQAAALLLAGAITVSPAAGAQEAAQRIDLAGALSRARAEARPVAAAEARRESAAQRLRQAKAYRLPEVRVAEMFIRTDSPADAFGLLLNQERFSFPSFVAGDPNQPDALETGITRLEADVPIWTGGELSRRVEQADLGLAAAAAGEAWSGDNAALEAARAYVRLAQAREQVRLLERARETVAAHVETARAFSDQGMLVRSELLRAEVELARMDDLLAAARGGAQVAEVALSFRLGAPLAGHWELADLPPPPPLAGDLASWQATAGQRADLEGARKQLAAGELEAKVARAGLLPRVGLNARHDWVDDRPFGTHGDSTTLTLMASVPLYDGGRRRAAIAAAEAQATAGRLDLAEAEEGARLAVEAAYEAARSSRQRRQTAVSTLAAAEEAVRITEERFRAGIARTIDLLDAVTARREAETRELVTRAEAHLASFELAVAAGRQPESVLAGAAAPGPPDQAVQPDQADQADQVEQGGNP